MIEHPNYEGFKNTSNLNKFCFSQQSPNLTSGMPYREGERGSKIPNIIDPASTGPRISARLANKTKQIYGIFSKFSLAVIGSCEVAKKPHIFLTIEN